MRKIALQLLMFLLINPFVALLYAQSDFQGTSTLPVHPRLLLLKNDEDQIKQSIAQNPSLAIVHKQILKESDKLLDKSPVERVLIGIRLLDKSREALRRIYFLSYSWRLTHDEKYLKRGEMELLAVSKFSDWHPAHFLDVAEMTTAVAIGYDWLYDGLSKESRSIIRDAILHKGLEASAEGKSTWWLNSTNNWNQVCNAGMTFGAIAIYEDQPEVAKTILARSIKSIRLPMSEFAPDGTFDEGFGYWDYGTTCNVLMLDAIEKVFHDDYGLSDLPGFLKTPYYFQAMTGQTGDGFNFSDCGSKSELVPATFWFANKLKDPSLIWTQKEHLTKEEMRANGGNRYLPSLMVWSIGQDLNNYAAPKKTFWEGGGKTPVALMRTSWTDPKAIYLAIKGGSASSNHAHMDVGSFVMESDGVRWAMDFGSENYNAIESNGVKLFDMKQKSQRWEVFRYNNLAHNTLTFNNNYQNVNGKANISSYSKDSLFMNAVVDLKDIYKDQIKKANRGVAIINKDYVVIKDEIETKSDEEIVRWNMLTPADVKIISNTKAELYKDGKKLILQIQEPTDAVLKTWSTQSPKAYESKNDGTTFVGFEYKLPAKSSTTLTVLLIPEAAKNKIKNSELPLKKWGKD